jgi:hypothetical protein
MFDVIVDDELASRRSLGNNLWSKQTLVHVMHELTVVKIKCMEHLPS